MVPEFFKPTGRKIAIAVLIIIFAYTLSIFFYLIGADSIAKITTWLFFPIANILLSTINGNSLAKIFGMPLAAFVAMFLSITIFIVDIVLYYLVACVIDKLVKS